MSDLVKRSQAERLAIAETLLASVWAEYQKGNIDRGATQTAVNIQVYANRIVWKLNSLNSKKDGADNEV